MYLERSEEEQRLYEAIKRPGETEQQLQARIDAALLFLHEGDSESLRDTLLMVSSGEVIYSRD